jgi:hypothetical protein
MATDIKIVAKAVVNDAIKELKKLQAESNNVGVSFNNLGATLKSATSVMGKTMVTAVAAAATAFAATTIKVAQLADEFDRLSETTGVPVKNLQELGYSAKLADVELGTMAKGLQLLSKNAVQNSKDFAALGINVKDAKGQYKDANTLFLEASDKLSKMGNATEKVAAAQKLFGKSGAELLPVLNQGSEALKKQTEQANRLGIVFSDKLVAQADSLGQSWDTMGMAWVGSVAKILDSTDALAKIGSVFDGITEGIVSAGDIFNTFSDNSIDGAEKTGTAVNELAKIVANAGFAFKVLYETASISFAGLQGLVKDAASNIDWFLGDFTTKLVQVGQIIDKRSKMKSVDKEEAKFQSYATNSRAKMIVELSVLAEKENTTVEKLLKEGTSKALKEIVKRHALLAGVQEKYSNDFRVYLSKSGELMTLAQGPRVDVIEDYAKKSGANWAEIEKTTTQSIENIVSAFFKLEKEQVRLGKIDFTPKKVGKKSGSTAGSSSSAIGSSTPTKAKVSGSLEGRDSFTAIFAQLSAEAEVNAAILDLTSKREAQRATILATFEKSAYKTREQTYNDSLKQLETTLNEGYKLTTESYNNGLISLQEAKAAELDLERAYSEEKMKIVDDETKRKWSKAAETADFYGAINEKILSTTQKVTDTKLALVDDETEELKSAAKAKILNERDLNKALSKIDDEAADKKRKIQKTQMGVNIAMAIADTAQAFIKSMAQWGSPLGLVFGGIAAAAGAVNIGIMAAQMAKMATGGVVGGDPSTGDSQHVMLTPGELVMNQKQQANTLMAVANGRNAQKPPINVTGGATTVVIQGNADRVVVEGALRANRQQQMKDMKALLKDMQYAGLVRLQVA